MTTSSPRPPGIGDPDGHGRYGILDVDEDGRLLCHECGRYWSHLATHVQGAHGISAADYRLGHGLARTARLVDTNTRERLRQIYDRNAAAHQQRLDTARDPQRATEASRESMRSGWRPATVAARTAQSRACWACRALTEAERAHLGDPVHVQHWPRAALGLLELGGVSVRSIVEACGLARGTVDQRLRRGRANGWTPRRP